MASPVLTKYLLKLATDDEEIVRFRGSKAEATQSMSEAGLTEEQREAVLSGDSDRLQTAVNAELGSCSITMAAAITTITHTLGLRLPAAPDA